MASHQAVHSDELALLFFIPIEPRHHYDAAIKNRGAGIVWQGEIVSSSENGNCILTFKRDGMAAGQYLLIITDRENPSRKFEFSFGL